MARYDRRAFLGQVGEGMLVAGLGASLSFDLGISKVLAADEKPGRLTFGPLEPLVALMQDTPPEKLTGLLVEKLKSGTSLRTLTTAGALANARSFGGQDYIGFHTFMALQPAFRMSQLLPESDRALPVLKVLYRNAARIQATGAAKAEKLHAIAPAEIPSVAHVGEHLRDISRKGDIEQADRAFVAALKFPMGEAYNHLQYAVEDEVDVHRVVLAWRAWDTMELVGKEAGGPEWSQALLRQSMRYCAKAEGHMIENKRPAPEIRAVLPKLLDQYKLVGRTPGSKQGDDAWLKQLATTLFRGSRAQAADAVAQALAEGFSVESVGEAMAVAANWLVLHDLGRQPQWASAEKPVGSTHGDSIGVHASDAAHAWRNIAAVTNTRNAVCSLIVGAFHTAGQSGNSRPQPLPASEHLAEVTATAPDKLLAETEAAIRNKDQVKATACVTRYGQLGHSPKAAFDLLLKYATSEDGALHAEKYFNTASDEFASLRATFRWGELVALARVTASEFGTPAPGYEDARKLLKS